MKAACNGEFRAPTAPSVHPEGGFMTGGINQHDGDTGQASGGAAEIYPRWKLVQVFKCS